MLLLGRQYYDGTGLEKKKKNGKLTGRRRTRCESFRFENSNSPPKEGDLAYIVQWMMGSWRLEFLETSPHNQVMPNSQSASFVFFLDLTRHCRRYIFEAQAERTVCTQLTFSRINRQIHCGVILKQTFFKYLYSSLAILLTDSAARGELVSLQTFSTFCCLVFEYCTCKICSILRYKHFFESFVS